MRNPMTIPMRLVASLLALFAVSSPAIAQTVLTPPVFNWGIQQNVNPGPVSIIGKDAITGLPCIIGGLTTCTLGGGAIVTDYEISAANTAQTFTYTLGSIHDTLSIAMACSAGTATLVVSASPDNSHFITIDSISAASATAKLYAGTTVGGTTAVSPLSFPFVRVTVGACGAGNTSTLYVGAN